MQLIDLTKGYIAIVDDEDYDMVSQFNWVALERRGRICAYKRPSTDTKKRYSTTKYLQDSHRYMHRMILGVTDKNVFVDHINGNQLDNRKQNLRYATPQENSRNRVGRQNKPYKGVRFRKDTRKWASAIKISKEKVLNLGCFVTRQEAEDAYDSAAQKYYGKFARLNSQIKKEIVYA